MGTLQGTVSSALRKRVAPPGHSSYRTRVTAHLSGRLPATTALRILLRQAGVDLSEPLLFVLAGGIGAGVFSFIYEKEDLATLFLAGRHLWADEQAYFIEAAKRLGFRAVVKESTSTKVGEQQLREALDQGHVVVAWVDLAHLPHRAAPARFSGGGYHVLTVYSIAGDSALIGDLGPAPVTIPLRDLGIARQRIAKQRNRLLWLERATGKSTGKPPTLASQTRDALKSCATALARAKMSNFRLDAFEELADRIVGTNKESWAQQFPPGGRMWTALTALYEYIECHGGGGLCRTIFAEGLHLAGFDESAERYAALGLRWTALADAALPDGIAQFREARELLKRKEGISRSGGSIADIRATWERLDRLASEVRKQFPLTSTLATELRNDLSARLREIHREEVAALAALNS